MVEEKRVTVLHYMLIPSLLLYNILTHLSNVVSSLAEIAIALPLILFRAHQHNTHTHTSGFAAQEEGGADDGAPQCPAAYRKVSVLCLSVQSWC